jgi:hypothetical protein
LTIEQETFVGQGRIVEQVVNERDEPLTKAHEWVVPLAIPVCMSDDVG